MSIMKTEELALYINNLYNKLKSFTERDLMVFFAEKTPQGLPGDYCFSDENYYYLGNVGDRGAKTVKKTKSLFEISYWIFEYQTSIIAFEYELKHRKEGMDCRRIAFAKQIELMNIIGDEYKQKVEEDISKILKEHPYQDGKY